MRRSRSLLHISPAVYYRAYSPTTWKYCLSIRKSHWHIPWVTLCHQIRISQAVKDYCFHVRNTGGVSHLPRTDSTPLQLLRLPGPSEISPQKYRPEQYSSFQMPLLPPAPVPASVPLQTGIETHTVRHKKAELPKWFFHRQYCLPITAPVHPSAVPSAWEIQSQAVPVRYRIQSTHRQS